MAVTFTNKAAKEMVERLHTIIDALPPELRATLEDRYHSLNFQRVGTFHSLFLKILKHDIETLGIGYTKSFGICDTGDTAKLIKKALTDQKAETVFETREIK
jgi:DNA helicase-2/ATP-dependent DNA helicase PcrA